MPERWVYGCYGVIGLLIYLNYSLLRLRSITISSKLNVVIPPFLDKRRRYDNSCCNALLCSLEGTWRLRNDTLYEADYNRVEDTNMKLRMRKGWPVQLYHGDMRCGAKFPLPRIIRQNNNEFYLSDIVSQCDSIGNAPCCRNDIGWCGRGDYYCKCESCFDYETIIHTELYEWVHALSCSRPALVKKDTCDFLAKEYTSITFIGDSLVRHVFSSLLIHMTDDPRVGALKADLHEADQTYCSYENQFVDSACHTKLATSWSEVKSHRTYCNTSQKAPKVSFVQAYSSQHKQLALDSVTEALQERRPLILLGIGIHDGFNHLKIIEEYLAPLLELRRQRVGYSNPVFVWLNTHASGPLKPIGYQVTQGNQNIIRFNLALKEYCRQNSVLLFDTFNITNGVHSFDGTHYGGALNKLKVELLIQSLKILPANSQYGAQLLE